MQELYACTETCLEAVCKSEQRAPATNVRRRRIAEYYYTYDTHAVLEFVQHTRAAKVRAYRDTAESMLTRNDAYNTIEDVYAASDGLVRTEAEVWEYSPVRFEMQSSNYPQNPERIKHLYVKYKQIQSGDKRPQHRSTTCRGSPFRHV